MNLLKHWSITLCVGLALIATLGHAEPSREKPRVIVTTDGEGDDQCSMVRFLLYTNDWDLEGIVITSSKHHWKGDGDVEGYKWLGTDWLDKQLAGYAEVYPNLKLHDSNYPSPESIQSNVYIGNILLEGDMREATPGSDHIVKVLLDSDPRPVWVQAWGGPNTIARALKTIQEDFPERMAEVSKKACIFMIAQQDKTYSDYIQKEWPDIMTLWSAYPSYGGLSYRWYNFQEADVLPYFEADWLMDTIVNDHGALTAQYAMKKGKYRSEGDSPSFLHLINTGLRSEENPAWGGWGGRFAPEKGALWKSTDQQGVKPHSILRWAVDFQHDWASRADWCVKPVKDANHPPVVKLSHSRDLSINAGNVVKLDATPTYDPDGDTLTFSWWHHREASTYMDDLNEFSPTKSKTGVLIPKDAKSGDTIHLICTVTDDGYPTLTRYARVVLTVQ